MTKYVAWNPEAHRQLLLGDSFNKFHRMYVNDGMSAPAANGRTVAALIQSKQRRFSIHPRDLTQHKRLVETLSNANIVVVTIGFPHSSC